MEENNLTEVPSKEQTLQLLGNHYLDNHPDNMGEDYNLEFIVNNNLTQDFINYLTDHIHTLLYESSKHARKTELKKWLKRYVREQASEKADEQRFLDKYSVTYKP